MSLDHDSEYIRSVMFMLLQDFYFSKPTSFSKVPYNVKLNLCWHS